MVLIKNVLKKAMILEFYEQKYFVKKYIFKIKFGAVHQAGN